jgi:class 3 adenylate cyclase
MATTTATRRLAAILAADVAGYSRLMGADEEGTHERLKAHLQQLVDPKVKEHHGRIVKNTGDGFLAEFASVVDAVRCAAEIQRGMVDRETDPSADRHIKFRIGVNLGDIIADRSDIFGDGVNVAARLEALAEPGGICVSRTVRDQIRDKLSYAFEDMGEQQCRADRPRHRPDRPGRRGLWVKIPTAVVRASARGPAGLGGNAAVRRAKPVRMRNRGRLAILTGKGSVAPGQSPGASAVSLPYRHRR